MLENITAISFYAIVTFSGLMVFTGTIIHKENSPLQRMLASFILVATSTMIGTTFFDYNPNTLFLFHYFLFGLINLLLIRSDTQILGLIVIEALVMLLALLLPLDRIPLSEDSFFNINTLFASLGIITLVILRRIVHKSKYDEAIKTTLAIIGIAILISLFVPEMYSLPINALLLALVAWYNITHVLASNAKSQVAMASRLKRLEEEFNDELRKAVNRQTFHLKEVQEKMSHINKIDNLTKAYNKKAIFDKVEEMIDDRRTPEFSMIMFDIDHFKNLNDTLGHIKGDLCLKTLSKIAHDCIRNTDYLGRFGGDEFLILLPQAKLVTAINIAERFRRRIAEETNPHFTVSIGVTHYPDDGNTLKRLLDIADKGLYYSKEKGRNSVSYNNPDIGKKY